MKGPQPPDINSIAQDSKTAWEPLRISEVAKELNLSIRAVLRLIADKKLYATASYQHGWNPLVNACVKRALEKGRKKVKLEVWTSWAEEERTFVTTDFLVLTESIRVLRFQLDAFNATTLPAGAKSWHDLEFSKVWLDNRWVPVDNPKLRKCLRRLTEIWTEEQRDARTGELAEAAGVASDEGGSLGDLFKRGVGKRIRATYIANPKKGTWGLTTSTSAGGPPKRRGPKSSD